MAWESRGNRQYLYQKLRIGGKVKSVYLGSGEAAVLLDRLEANRRKSGRIENEEQTRKRLNSEKLDEELNSLSEFNKSLVDALFLLNGYHQHKRQWRKKRK